MRYVFVLTALSLLSSCSGVQKISNNAVEIHETAESSKARFGIISENIRVNEYVDKDLIQRESLAGAQEQDYIINLAKEVIQTIPSVEDSVPWWANAIQWGFISLAIVGTLVILWYLGLGYPIKAFMRLFSSFIPQKKRESAKLLLEAQDDTSSTTLNEAVAVMRAQDKDFDAAYKKQRRQHK